MQSTTICCGEFLGWGEAQEASDCAPTAHDTHRAADATERRRRTSDTTLDVAEGCCFERVRAPVIRFGAATSAVPLLPSPSPLPIAGLASSAGLLPGASSCSSDLFGFDGDVVIPAGRRYCGSMIVRGVLHVCAGSIIEGDVHAHRGVLLGQGAQVTGSITSDLDIHLMPQSFVAGPISSKTTVHLDRQACVGRHDFPTTVSARTVLAQAGSSVHGAVWAHRFGVVWCNRL